MIFFIWTLALPWLSLLLSIVSLPLLQPSFVLVIPCCPAALLSYVRVFSSALRATSRFHLPVPGVVVRSVRHGLHVQAQRFPVLGLVELPGPVLFVNVTLSLLHPVLLIPLHLGHPRLSKASVPSGIVAGCKDQFRLSLKEHGS